MAYVWGLWQENIGINQIVDSGYVLCWAAKWYNDKHILFSSINEESPKTMLKKIHVLLEEADVVVHYNGTRFDIPTLNKEFVTHNIRPPSPYKQIDLYRVVRSKFRFQSNKLDFIVKALGLGEKIRHKGFELWVECMNGIKGSWKKMKEYNIQDVLILENLYTKILPWISNHPNYGLYSDKDNSLLCPNCGSGHYHKKGLAYTTVCIYQRYTCQDCGKSFRDNVPKNKGKVKFKGI